LRTLETQDSVRRRFMADFNCALTNARRELDLAGSKRPDFVRFDYPRWITYGIWPSVSDR